ncbi:MAG: DNA polymerase IV [Gammaproteobacteria bacterium]|nr:DNA polymerase IV [Gammaproteobacteria bacterium]
MRKIIHIDMDAFFAAVEQLDFPEYRQRPVIVGGPPDRRGVVAAASYEARQFGIHSAMPSSQAYRLCPHAIFTVPRFERYREVSRQLQHIFRQYTDLVEPLSLDEAYLDVTHVWDASGSATALAKKIQQDIFQQLQLTASAGVSYNKFLAKIASDINKPNGLYVITPEKAPAFIAALPIGKFFGIGKATEGKLHKLGIYTGADLKNWEKAELIASFGKLGAYCYELAHGIDDRPVVSNRVRKSIGKEITFEQDLSNLDAMRGILEELAHQVWSALQRRRCRARTLVIKIKYADFTQITRSRSFEQGLDNLNDTLLPISVILAELLASTDAATQPVRLLGVTATNLMTSDAHAREQLQLF